jgi:hypothetical protein
MLESSHQRHLHAADERRSPTRKSSDERTIVVVLGTHRSGSSLCAHLLQALGIDMADDPDVKESNAKGHWERAEIMALQDEVLGAFNRDVYSVAHDLPLPSDWCAQPPTRSVKQRLKQFLRAKLAENALVGFKDPRTVRLLPMWHEIFRDLSLSPRYVMCLRNPAQVARSLQARDGIAPALGEYRWLIHVLDFLRYTKNRPVCIVEYEAWFPEALPNLRKLLDFVGHPSDREEIDLSVLASDVVDVALRHDQTASVVGNTTVRYIYENLRRWDTDPKARHNLEGVLGNLISFQQLLAPFLEIIEQHDDAVDRDRESGGLHEANARLARSLEAERDRLEAAQAVSAARSGQLAARLREETQRLAAVREELAGLT